MVSEQELLAFMREEAYKPLTYQELEKHFELEGAEEFKLFLRMLNELEQRGEIYRTRKDRYGIPERMNLLKGRMQSHPKGFGFLIPEQAGHPDVYIHANDMKGAMNGDTVLVRVNAQERDGSRMEGEVIRVVKRANTQVVGTFEGHGSYGFVIPDDRRMNRDLFVPQEAFGGAVDGQKVVAKIVRYPDGRSAAAQGEIVEILGHKNDPGVDILSIIRKYGLPEAFPEEVMAEALAAPDTISEGDLKGRRDLRGKRIVTIDGEDAKDLDDAVNVERLDNGNVMLGVHIADVGYYVRENSALDREAYNRGTSVYLVDRVIPMLPHRLSNGICSLNPQVDRLTLSCEMEIDEQARVVRHEIFPSVIRTVERMTYANVRRLLKEDVPELRERYGDLLEDFRLMEELAMRLRQARMDRGAIDFDFSESKILVDENGKPYDIVKRERSIAEMIIEEFMLAANETVAEHHHWLKVPFLYRVHEDPDGEKLQHFMEFVSNFGYTVKGRGNKIHPRALQKVLEEIEGTKEQTVISTVLLRSMKQARYDAESLGHFGLAAEFYSHFTSPIRRYPDLVIHRVICEVIMGGGRLSEGRLEHLAARMPDIAQQSSERERVAVDAERDTDDLKKAEFMLDKVGEEFDGLISGVTNFGIFVELENTVEGLIRLSDLSDDYYHYHEDKHCLIGERTSKIYSIGDEVKVRVARVNLDERAIDFEMLDIAPRSAGAGGAPRREVRGGRGGKRQEGRGRGKGAGRRGAGDAAADAGAGVEGGSAAPAAAAGKGGRRKRGGGPAAPMVRVDADVSGGRRRKGAGRGRDAEAAGVRNADSEAGGVNSGGYVTSMNANVPRDSGGGRGKKSGVKLDMWGLPVAERRSRDDRYDDDDNGGGSGKSGKAKRGRKRGNGGEVAGAGASGAGASGGSVSGSGEGGTSPSGRRKGPGGSVRKRKKVVKRGGDPQ